MSLDGKALHDAVRQVAGERLQSATVKEQVATIVLDVGGMDAPAREALSQAVRQAAMAAGAADVRVAMTAEKRAAPLILAVGSGKGGVGKSTLSANLAVALARSGKKVGLVDADIYGPSQARLLATEGMRPTAEGNKLHPVQSPWGLPLLSMGHLVQPGQAIAWRGPMASNALGQLTDAIWGDIELLVVDLPPGTGDVQLTMLQKHKPAGAVIVSTPQDLALMDAKRAMQLFEVGGVPVVGLVENMAGYACPHCGEVSDPFGKGGAQTAAASLGETFLGRVPLAWEIRVASDTGQPPAANDGPHAEAFVDIAQQIGAWLDGAQG